MRLTQACYSVALLLLPSGAISFSGVNQPQQPTSRSAFFRDVSNLVIASTVLTPLVAHADVTAKLASSSALRKVKSCQNKLGVLESAVASQDYMTIRQSLREAPFSDLRKSMTTLVKGGEDGPNAEQLASQYKTFIASLEALDARTSLGLRGQKIGADEWNGAYEAVQNNLRGFLVLAEASADIPVQYDNDVSPVASI